MIKIFMYAVVVALVIPYLLYIFYKILNGKWKRSSMPPTNWPVFGMMPAILLNVGHFHEYATEMLQQSGGTIFFRGPWFANLETVATCDPANVHYILSKNFKNFPKGPDYNKMLEVLGDGILAAESISWESQRKVAMSLMKGESFLRSVAASSWNKVQNGLIPILDHVSEMGAEVDLQDLFQRLAFDCACIQMRWHSIDLPYQKVFMDAEEAIWQRYILPETLWKLQKWLHIGKEKKFSQSIEILDQFLSYCMSLVSHKLKENDPTVTCKNEGSIFFSRFMRLIAEKGTDTPQDSKKFSRDVMLNFIAAGKDTISTSLTWFFWLLATHPDEETKIRREIITNLKVDEVGKWKFDSMDGLKTLHYLHGALCETLRLYPPLPVQHRSPLQPDKLPSGHVLSQNTKVLLFLYSMGRMESIWGKDCLEFKPSRWISASGNVKIEPSYKFTSFSAGPRSCIGKEMSFVQLKIVIAAIISRYHIQVVEGHPVSPRSSAALHMKHGLKVKVSNRV